MTASRVPSPSLPRRSPMKLIQSVACCGCLALSTFAALPAQEKKPAGKGVDPNSPQARLCQSHIVACVDDRGIVYQIGLPITEKCMARMEFLRDPQESLLKVVNSSFPICLCFGGDALT